MGSNIANISELRLLSRNGRIFILLGRFRNVEQYFDADASEYLAGPIRRSFKVSCLSWFLNTNKILSYEDETNRISRNDRIKPPFNVA
jgi:hypothetical protein